MKKSGLSAAVIAALLLVVLAVVTVEAASLEVFAGAGQITGRTEQLSHYVMYSLMLREQ